MSFGTLLGKTKFSVAVYNNVNAPLNRQKNFYRGEFTGLKYECVEFARRFLIAAKGFTFPAVQSAVQIWDLKRFISVEHQTEIPIRQYYPVFDTKPLIGDLVIFARSVDAPHGHVGVVINSRRYQDKLVIYICDQNFSTQPFTSNYNGRLIVDLTGKVTSDRGIVIGLIGPRYM